MKRQARPDLIDIDEETLKIEAYIDKHSDYNKSKNKYNRQNNKNRSQCGKISKKTRFSIY